MSKRLIIFTRYPEPGQTKTRLIATLGAEGAAHLHQQMTEHTLAQVRRFAQQHQPQTPDSLLELEIRFTGGDEQLMGQWLGRDLIYRSQGEGHLGDRLQAAVADAFEEGCQSVVIIGTDCPDLGIPHLHQAFAALADQDVVLGPAADGGYYLIGLRRSVPELFLHIDWGSSQVLHQTLKAATGAGLQVAKLETLADVDRPSDLSIWLKIKAARQQQISLSIVIPTLNEAETIGPTLATLQASLEAPGTPGTPGTPGAAVREDFGTDDVSDAGMVEILVVDGGSLDNTCEIAESCGVQVIHTPPGRAYQMNEGAGEARGDILLFLHADTHLPPHFIPHLRKTLAKPGVVAGAFRLRIGGKGWGLRLVEWGANLRSRLLQLPYGDQALFLRRTTFQAVGGFADLPIMEDFELVRRLQRRGFIALAPVAVTTSSRRWHKLGICRTLLTNQLMILGYFLGIPPQRLATWYRSPRH